MNFLNSASYYSLLFFFFINIINTITQYISATKLLPIHTVKSVTTKQIRKHFYHLNYLQISLQMVGMKGIIKGIKH